MKNLLFILLLGLPFIVSAQNFKGKPTGKEKIESSKASFEQQVLALVNKERRKRHKKPLKWNDQLAYAARYHAKDMAVDNYFSHTSQDQQRNGTHKKVCDTFERMGKFVIKDINVRAENIAAGQKDPKEVMKGWMSSKGHRLNILDKRTKYIGIGYIEISSSKMERYWVQNFGM